MRNRGLLLLAILCAVLPLSGCWDAEELNRRAVVSGIGIDRAPGEQEYRVSFQVIIADEISGKSGRGATPTMVYSAQGRSVMEAVRKVSLLVPRLVSTAHTRIVVISEELARQGISDIVDFLDRDSDIRLTTKIYIAKNGVQAHDIISGLTPMGKITAYSIAQKTEMTAQEFGANYPIELDDIIRDLLVPDSGPVINGVDILGSAKEVGKKSNLEKTDNLGIIRMSNLALFKGDKLKGWLDEEESLGLVWIKDKMNKTPIIIAPDGLGEISLDVRRSKTSIRVIPKDPEHPVVVVKVTAQLSIREMDSTIDLRDPAALSALEVYVNKEIVKKMKSAVSKAQSLNSDIFCFGQKFERQHPKAWKQLKGKWSDLFPKLEVEYQVDSIVRNSQMRDRSFKYDLKEE
ncbi:Ger(x)C family spore germination protein [Paenibacillus timonensis]|jgi:spore germination protein KC|uniref:Ger(X)C family spore germination protein n=1 Tax=Paenibacillus timonensis TaxID=225915 RepID=A0ABW3SE92_9BACL|nr:MULTISPECIES: Ger(x)C family spore germination protein [Paenibacillus]MCH1640809.1 Ger(x)C family spore germination protein [Paenibacillus timonensis]MDU2241555.1 Ger(x)C family spore germination protein [Paenibacillus sp.]